ncbi:hypothetical protein [Pseudofrankia asymbiotica]|uniref:Uncharacterized protein n=1 Tax=Pseudofrankia asymbiotica TaxID=1834516 RepID=A0A1V2IJ23_9ACTN|nr:hypothetical protein [Pseudofrankia asymbiotica]ONH33117.1 hypothetical protein BL253_02850 [Pseudofrankia asymbiotica]
MTIETTGTAATTGAADPASQAGQAPPAPPAVDEGAGGARGGSRADAFRSDMAALRIRDPRARTEGALLRLGAVLLAAGPVLGVIAYVISHGTTNPLQQRDAIVLGTVAVSISVAGAALFVRYSMAAFLRFWLARILFDRQNPPA